MANWISGFSALAMGRQGCQDTAVCMSRQSAACNRYLQETFLGTRCCPHFIVLVIEPRRLHSWAAVACNWGCAHTRPVVACLRSACMFVFQWQDPQRKPKSLWLYAFTVNSHQQGGEGGLPSPPVHPQNVLLIYHVDMGALAQPTWVYRTCPPWAGRKLLQGALGGSLACPCRCSQPVAQGNLHTGSG